MVVPPDRKTSFQFDYIPKGGTIDKISLIGYSFKGLSTNVLLAMI